MIRRSSPPRRASQPKRSAKPIRRSGKPKTKPRGKDEAERIYGPVEFRVWLHQQPCAVCGFRGEPEQMQQCHAITGGMSRKSDWEKTFPGCGPHWEHDHSATRDCRLVEGCHAEAGRIGVRSFERAHDVVLLDLAAQTQNRWRALRDGAVS